MATPNDIAQIILLLQAAFPNYHPEQATPEALYQLLQDLPSDALKVAVLATCSQAGRAFAPSVGEIREAVLKLSIRMQAIPNEFEAWKEVREMPASMLRGVTLEEQFREMLQEFDSEGRRLIYRAHLKWSHPLVEKVALEFGWPDFPGENESTDRAHFLQAYRTELNKMMEEEGELPAVRKYIEAQRRDGRQLIGQEVKKLAEGMKK